MSYRILFKEPGKSRRETWDAKNYPNKKSAQKVIDRDVEHYKHSKYVKDVKPQNFKIVKKEERTTSPFGVSIKMPSFKF